MNNDLESEILGEFPPYELEELTKETILNEEIFKYLFALTNNIQKTRILVQLQEKAKELKVSRSFNNLLKAYQQEYVQQIKQQGSKTIEFTDCPLENLKCGKWECKDMGVTKTIMNNFEAQVITACPHPILPVERLINIEDQTEKVKLAFYKDKKWQNIVVGKGTIANTGNIVQLANRGIEVNSNTAKELVNYLSDIINLNITEIPLRQSTEHLRLDRRRICTIHQRACI